jgi:S1-C subfamily serine protease
VRAAREPAKSRPAAVRLVLWAAAAGILAGCSAAAGQGTGQAAVSGAAGAGTGAGGTAAAAAAAVEQEFVSVIKRVMPSVVEIRTSAGLGSGVVLDAQGDIVTNAHVVEAASAFQVLSVPAAGAQPASEPAVLVGSCPAEDLAVIRVSQSARLRPATFGNGSDVAVGDLVLAIGSPLGLGGSVTDGIVSAIGRSVTEPASSGAPAAVLADTIQTSAAINPGNSGGALVDIAGDVIGIPTLAAVNRGAGGAAPGIGFAIPAGLALTAGRQLLAGGQCQ